VILREIKAFINILGQAFEEQRKKKRVKKKNENAF